MALNTYSALQTAVASLLNRDDLTSAIPDFITLAEADMNRKIRHWRMESRSTADLDAQFAEAPSDWLESVRFLLQSDPVQELELLALPKMVEYRSRDGATGKPRYYAWTGGQFELYPTPDTAYTAELVYYARITALSDAAPSNWLLQYHPDAYLYGAAAHSAPYLHDDERLTTWASLYANAIAGINEENRASRWSGTGLRIRTRAG